MSITPGEAVLVTLDGIPLPLDRELFPDIALKLVSSKDEQAGRTPVTLPAHKLILSAHSDYFSRMFQSGMREEGSQEVVLIEDQPEAVKQLLDLMYTHSTQINSDLQLCRLLEVVSKYQVLRELDRLLDLVDERLDKSTISMYYELADKLSLTRLRGSCREYLTGNPEHWATAPYQLVHKLLPDDDLDMDEVEIFRGVIEFIKGHSSSCEPSQLLELLSQVRVENLVNPDLRPVWAEVRSIQPLDLQEQVLDHVGALIGRAYVSIERGLGRPVRTRAPGTTCRRTGLQQYTLTAPYEVHHFTTPHLWFLNSLWALRVLYPPGTRHDYDTHCVLLIESDQISFRKYDFSVALGCCKRETEGDEWTEELFVEVGKASVEPGEVCTAVGLALPPENICFRHMGAGKHVVIRVTLLD